MILKNVLKSFKLLKQSSRRMYSYEMPFMHFLRNLPSTNINVLCNGLTVASEERLECPSVAVGLFIEAGARYETTEENGINHFLEHIIFKGIGEGDTGAQFRCRAGRDMVSLTSECIITHTPEIIEALASAAFKNPLVPEEITKQKEIVMLELLEHESDYSAITMDYLHATAFQGTALGQNILGRCANIKSFDQTRLKQYLDQFWVPWKAVLVVVGGVCHDRVMDFANAYFGDIQNVIREPKCVTISETYRYTGSEIRFRNDALPMAHIAIAVEGPSFCDDDTIPLNIAAHYLGGWHKSFGYSNANRLSQAASHFAEGYKAFNLTYKDTGLWGVHFLSESLNQDDMMFNIQNQWMKLCTSITDCELERAKYEYKSALLYKTESNAGTCHEIGRWILLNGSRRLVPDIIDLIDKTNANDIREACFRYIYDKCPAVAAVGPTEGLYDYVRIRSDMYWLRL